MFDRAVPPRVVGIDSRPHRRSRVVSAAVFGERGLAPILLEVCTRLHEHAVGISKQQDAVLLFCAQGGLRLELAFTRYLEAMLMTAALASASFMVSRLIAMLASLWCTIRDEESALGCDADQALARDFQGMPTRQVLTALIAAGVEGPDTEETAMPVTGERLLAVLKGLHGEGMRAALRDQTELFHRHLEEALKGRTHAVLVDTGRW